MKDSIIKKACEEAAENMNVLIDTQLRPLYEMLQKAPAKNHEDLNNLNDLLIAMGTFINNHQSIIELLNSRVA